MNLTQFLIHLGTDGQIAVAIYLAAMIGSLILLTTERRIWNQQKGYQRREFAPIKPVQLTSKSFSHLED